MTKLITRVRAYIQFLIIAIEYLYMILCTEDFVRYRIIRDEYSDDDDDYELGHENIHTRELPRDTNAPLSTGRRGGHKFSAMSTKTENFAPEESILITENQASSLRRKCQSCNRDGYPICTNLY